MKRELRNLKRLEYNLADDEDDSKPERVEDVESILVDRLKKVEDTFDEIEYTRVVISGIERLHIIQYAMTNIVFFLYLIVYASIKTFDFYKILSLLCKTEQAKPHS